METNNIEQPEIKKKKATTPIVILAIGVVIAIIAVVCVLSVKGQNSKKYQEQLDVAHRFLEDMDYVRAIAAFEEAIKIDPNRFGAYEGLADLYMAMAQDEISNGNYDGGVDLYKKAGDVIEKALSNVSSDNKDIIEKYKKNIEDSIDVDKLQEIDGNNQIHDTESSIPDFSAVRVGNVVNFGTFNGQPIEWDVLEAEDGSVLLISRYILVDRVYDQEGVGCENITDTNWARSEIRAWLNGEFYNTSFTAEEQSRIQTVINNNPSSAEFYANYYPDWHFEENTNPCGDTEDKIFLLSWEEMIKYYDIEIKEDRVYSKKAGTSGLAGSTYWWWLLRSAGDAGDYVMGVNYNDYVNSTIIEYGGGIRPALRVSF